MKAFIFFCCMTISFLLTSFAHAGFESGNGGDSYAAEFILTGRDVLQRLELLFAHDKPVIDTARLRIAITSTEVVSADHVFLGGFERDAVNHYPDKPLIEVSRTRWNELRRSTNTKERLRLVLHEYLWMSGVDDTNYTHSEHLIELLNIGNYSPSIWWNPVNPANTITAQLEYTPVTCTFQPGKMDVKLTAETLVMEPAGDCKDAYRKLKIVKSTGVAPPSGNVRGLFHRYDLTVFDSNENVLGSMAFIPDAGVCLLPESGTCRYAGTMSIGGVDIVFWFLRN